MHYWNETEENRSVSDVVAKYDDFIGFSGEEIVTRGYLGDMFPKIAKELESLGYHYSREKRRFLSLVRETKRETLEKEE